ncbi:OrE15CTE, partial [Eciton burchellii]
MHILELTFKILMISGFWRPQSWSSFNLRVIYSAYTIFVFTLMHTFLMFQFFDIIWNVNNVADFIENFYMILFSFLSCTKMLNILAHRNNILMLTNILIEKPHKPLGIDEEKIQCKFDKLIYTRTLYWIILTQFTAVCIFMMSLLTVFRKGKLTYRAWLPYNYYSSMTVYCLTHAYQLISMMLGALINVTTDTLICGLLLHICCQIEILECRLNRMPGDHDILRDCVLQHNSIFVCAHSLNNDFGTIIAVQFIVSTMMICSNLYQMAKSTVDYFSLLLYTSCILIQIFIYCWYANKVKLKSVQLVDNIFAIDWLALDRKITSGLLIIMNRAAVPIEFTCVYVISMNLDSFVG